jgi:hydrogenase maturation protease
MSPRVLVVGIGHPQRSDDGLGPAVTRALREAGLVGARIVDASGDMVGLLELWEGADAVVLVDATRGAGEPGRVLRIDAQQAEAGAAAFVSSHAFDLAGALALARALDRLPREIVLFGVEGASFASGASLSPEVAASVPAVAAAVQREVQRLRGSDCDA